MEWVLRQKVCKDTMITMGTAEAILPGRSSDQRSQWDSKCQIESVKSIKRQIKAPGSVERRRMPSLECLIRLRRDSQLLVAYSLSVIVSRSERCERIDARLDGMCACARFASANRLSEVIKISLCGCSCEAMLTESEMPVDVSLFACR